MDSSIQPVSIPRTPDSWVLRPMEARSTTIRPASFTARLRIGILPVDQRALQMFHSHSLKWCTCSQGIAVELMSESTCRAWPSKTVFDSICVSLTWFEVRIRMFWTKNFGLASSVSSKNSNPFASSLRRLALRIVVLDTYTSVFPGLDPFVPENIQTDFHGSPTNSYNRPDRAQRWRQKPGS